MSRRVRSITGIVVAALGLLLAVAASYLSMQSLRTQGDYHGVALLGMTVGGPAMLVGVGLTALGLRIRSVGPGPAPLWHRISGGLLSALGLLLALVAIFSAAEVFLIAGRQHLPIGYRMAGLLDGLALPLVFAALFGWLGIVLIRPRR